MSLVLFFLSFPSVLFIFPFVIADNTSHKPKTNQLLNSHSYNAATLKNVLVKRQKERQRQRQRNREIEKGTDRQRETDRERGDRDRDSEIEGRVSKHRQKKTISKSTNKEKYFERGIYRDTKKDEMREIKYCKTQ